MEKVFNSQVFLAPPEDFAPNMQSAACFCLYQDHFLLVKRQSDRPQPNKWCLPGGKLEPNEEAQAAVIRELQEELDLSLSSEKVHAIGKLFIRVPASDYIFHIFYSFFSSFPPFVLDLSENQEARWTTLKEALMLPLVIGGTETLEFFQRIRMF